ncbi:MAG: exodeoxyribonuclease VII large subunit [Gammaproteobacteria bacterium]
MEDFETQTETPYTEREVYTVSRLNREVRGLLETGYPAIWVEAEVSNLARPASGHMYFSLKDASAQLRCAMFRGSNRRLNFRPADGASVLCRGRLSLYEARGEYQFVVDHMELAGEGKLQRAFEDLKRRLAGEGLFDSAQKRPIPALPRRIGVITSPSGAAVRDILHVLARRFPAVPVSVYPVPVQGETAAPAIVQALQQAATRADCEVLILARGGGSLEDLWAFNEEIVARAIHACPIPVISGVGHEIDFTIADFVADVRAPTPSGAAELAVPDQAEWLRDLAAKERRLTNAVIRYLRAIKQRSDWLQRRVGQLHPGTRLSQQAQRLDELERNLLTAWERGRARRHDRIERAWSRLRAESPAPLIRRERQRLHFAGAQLSSALNRVLLAARQRLDLAQRSLSGFSPQTTLARGYAIVTTADGSVVRDPAQTRAGAHIDIRVAAGRFGAMVENSGVAETGAKDDPAEGSNQV